MDTIPEFTIRQIAEALNITPQAAKKRSLQNSWSYREEPSLGGKRHLYRLTSLPAEVQAALLSTNLVRLTDTNNPVSDPNTDEQPPPKLTPIYKDREAANGKPAGYDPEALWQWTSGRSQKLRDAGVSKAAAVARLEKLLGAGHPLRAAAILITAQAPFSAPTLRRWYYQAKRYAPQDRSAALIPGWSGSGRRKQIPTAAWDWFTAYHLTRSQPTLAEAYRRTVEAAAAQGWGDLPCERTFANRLKSDVCRATRVFLREGGEALAKLHPSQRRDKSGFQAGEAVTGDGLKFDRLWVRWPDGEILNTTTGWFWADIRTGYLAAWRLAQTETTDLFRLATYDLTRLFKPRLAWVDNTMVAAAKAMTAGAEGRRRGKDRVDDPIGLLPQIGIEVRFTNPDKTMGSPGAKPIERSFGIGGIHDKVATHPRFLNRGYSRKTAIPYEEFAEVVRNEVIRFNRQPKRRTAACRGVLSYEQAFEELFTEAVPTKLTEAQRDLLLLVPEVVRADSRSGEIRLKAGKGPMGQHRYWTEALTEFKGRQVTVYYDPEDLAQPVSVSTLGGRFVAHAEHLANTGFADTAAAREWNRNKARKLKAQKKVARAEKRMKDLEVAAAYPDAEEGTPPEPGVVAGNFGQKRQVDKLQRVVGGETPREDEEGLSAVDRFVLENKEAWNRETFG